MPKTGKNNERTERIPPRNRKLTKVEPLRPQAQTIDKRYNDLAKFPSENPYPILRIHKDGTVLYANKASEPLLKAKETAVSLPAPPEWQQLAKNVLSSGQVTKDEITFNERVFAFMVVPIAENDYVNFYGTDITEQKIAQEVREITIKLLSLINSRNQIHDLMKLVTALLRDWSGCEAVGIRLQDGEDFPYFETNGFSDEFLKAENKLCSYNELGEPIRDSQGRVFLECMCGNIISGRFNPFMSFFTKHGSFWTNSTTVLLASTTDADRLTKTRNRCNTAGYESVALVPLRTGQQTFGLLQFNSKQKDRFTPDKITLFERLADNLAIGLAQRKTEESLRESEDKFRHVFDYSPIGKSITLPSGEIQANKALCEMLGYSREELKVRKWQEITHPDDIRETQKSIDSILSEQKDSVQFFKRYLHKNGSVIWADVCTSLRRDNKGKPLYFMTTIVDITARKQAEESLLISEARYRRLFEAARDGILILDAETGLIVDVNPFIENILGYSHKEFSDKHLWEIGLFKNIAASKEAFMELRAKGYVRYDNMPLETKDGRQIAVEFVSNVYMVDHRKVIQCNIRDITERARVEESLQISETRFRELFNNMSSGVAIYDAVDDGSDFIIRDFNTAGQGMEEISKEDAVGKRVTHVFPGVKEMGILDVFRRVWKTGKTEYFPTSFYKDGRISGWRENQVYKLPSGEVVAVYDDVTERQTALEKLQEERNLLRTLIDHIPDGVYIKDKEGRILGYNKSLAESWDARGREDIIGKTDFDLFTPEVAQHYFDEERKIMQTGQPIINKEAQCTDKSGNANYLLVTKVPLQDSAGNITGLVGIHRDITERKQAEKQLTQSHDLLANLARLVPGVIYQYRLYPDGSSAFPYSSPGMNDIYEVTPEEVREDATPVFGRLHPDDYNHVYELIQESARTLQTFYCEFRVILPRQGLRWRWSQAHPEQMADGGTLWHGIISDITERKMAEQKILEYQKRLKQLASKLSLAEEQERRRIAGELHDEVSQTLAMAKIKLDTLQNSPPSETSAAALDEISSYIKKVIQETRTLTFELSNPILYELGFEAAVAEWLDETVQDKHGIATEFYDDELPKPLNDDLKAMLFRNTRELLTNCIKHAKAGKIIVGIRRIDDSIQVTVEDNGVGFDHVQVRATASKKGKFGLFSIRESMENTGGRFEIQSKPGAGCKALMTAPLKDQNNMKEI
jgi:PAS domain S-box-containing protein